jgi:hypothetical protein
VIVDRLASRDVRDGVERSARVRVAGQEHRLFIACPAGFACQEDDASPFLAAALLPAMRTGEDLEVDGEVSPRLLRRIDRVQSLYQAWDHSLRRADVRVAGERAPAGGERVASFFSRGADSMYTAAAERSDDGPPTTLLFGETLEPVHDDRVRAHEVSRAREAAERLGLPLITFRTNLREFSDGLVFWSDYHGAGLAFAALALSGGLRRIVVPATGWYGNVERFGSSPLLDPLFSTETLEVEHGSLERSRVDKLIWLAENRRDLLPYLKVCFAENRPDNCGRCDKCLRTMVALEAAGALGDATEFPDRIDLRELKTVRMAILSGRIDWAEAAAVLRPDGHQGELRRAIVRLLRQSARPSLRLAIDRLRGRRPRARRAWTITASAFRRHEAREMVSLMIDGRPYW